MSKGKPVELSAVEQLAALKLKRIEWRKKALINTGKGVAIAGLVIMCIIVLVTTFGGLSLAGIWMNKEAIREIAAVEQQPDLRPAMERLKNLIFDQQTDMRLMWARVYHLQEATNDFGFRLYKIEHPIVEKTNDITWITNYWISFTNGSLAIQPCSTNYLANATNYLSSMSGYATNSFATNTLNTNLGITFYTNLPAVKKHWWQR